MKFDSITGVATGNHELDKLTGGWQQSDLIFVYSESKESVAEFFNKQICGVMQSASTNIGVICRNIPMVCYNESCSRRELIIECGGGNLKIDVLEQPHCEIIIFSNQEISVPPLRWLVRKMVNDFGVGIVFIEDLGMITIPFEFKFPSLGALKLYIIRYAKAMALDSNIPVIASMENLSPIEQHDNKMYRDCDVVGELTNHYSSETEEYEHELNVVKLRYGSVGRVKL